MNQSKKKKVLVGDIGNTETKIYFKNNYRTLLSTKADLEYFKEFGRDYIKRTNAGNSNLLASIITSPLFELVILP